MAMTCTKKINPTTVFPIRSLRTETSFPPGSLFVAAAPVAAVVLAWEFMTYV